jgi:uncharacterized membrane protein
MEILDQPHPIYKESHARSVTKSITWRIIGTFDTMVLSFLFTGQLNTALKIGAVEVFTKITLYYLHERGWQMVPRKKLRKIGDIDTEVVIDDLDPLHDLKEKILPEKPKNRYTESHLRSIYKGISWRIIGTIDTIVLSWLITGELNTAIKIGLTEVITKLVLYYLHERAWQLMPRGTFRYVAKKLGFKLKSHVPLDPKPDTDEK